MRFRRLIDTSDKFSTFIRSFNRLRRLHRKLRILHDDLKAFAIINRFGGDVRTIEKETERGRDRKRQIRFGHTCA